MSIYSRVFREMYFEISNVFKVLVKFFAMRINQQMRPALESQLSQTDRAATWAIFGKKGLLAEILYIATPI